MLHLGNDVEFDLDPGLLRQSGEMAAVVEDVNPDRMLVRMKTAMASRPSRIVPLGKINPKDGIAVR